MRMVGRFDKGSADGLLAEEFVQDAMLNPLHQVLAKRSNDRRVDAGGHNSKGIACRHKAIDGGHLFKTNLKNLDIWKRFKSPAECFAHFGFRMDQTQRRRHARAILPQLVESDIIYLHFNAGIRRSSERRTFVQIIKGSPKQHMKEPRTK